jgi:hypothetical protein
MILTIGGNDVTDKTDINSVTCTIGRTSITDQPQPSTFSCTLTLDIGNNYFDGAQLNEDVEWKLDNPVTGGYTPIFYGKITDINLTLDRWGNGNGLRTYSISAMGLSQDLTRFNVDAGLYAKQYDGVRIAALLTTIGFSTTEITVPGDYEIAKTSENPITVLQLANDAANSGMGVLFEDHQLQKMVYQSYLDRTSNPVITLTTDQILAGTYTLGQSTTSIANRINTTYGASGTTGTTYTDATSVAAYGYRDGSKQTTLHNVSDANTISQMLLTARANPLYDLQSITIDTSLLDAATYNSLLNMRLGTIISIDNLPTSDLNSFKGFVESYTWTALRNHQQVTMYLSNYGTQYPYTLWNQLNNTDTWNTYATATTTWSDII